MINNLREIKKIEKEKGLEVDDVKYLGKATIIKELDGKKKQIEINVYEVLEGKTVKYYSDDMFLGVETANVGKSEPAIIPSPEYEKTYESGNPIKDVIGNLKQRERKEKEKPIEERTTVSLKEIEDKDKEQKLVSDKQGATSLDQEVDRRTLRNLMNLEGDDAYIKPITASDAKRKYGVNINNKDWIEIIKTSGESRLADQSIVKPDVQEGNNSFNQDLNLEVNGDVEYKSNTTSLELANMPNHYISIGYDEGTTNKEIKFSKRSGREGHNEPEKELKKEGASEYQDPEQRNITRRNEEGIGEPDEIIKRQKAHEEVGCKNDRVENIDLDENNNSHIHIDPNQKIPGTDITWQRFANMCGYRGEKDGVEKAYKEFKKYEEDNKNLENSQIIEDIVEGKENEMPGPNRRR